MSEVPRSNFVKRVEVSEYKLHEAWLREHPFYGTNWFVIVPITFDREHVRIWHYGWSATSARAQEI